METSQFDSTLGGSEHLPYSANSLKFAAARSIEIAAMTESILRPNKNKLIFQTLPVHMRRRVMSHNCKRLPIRLREGHLEQLKKSGLPPKQKRPSRKHRRRPGNLLEEYNRRQKKNVWLETHIWHAKRFHMVERWGHRLAYAPCDKAFRACYRAGSTQCLLQDISYYTPIEITGQTDAIKEMFSCITSSSCGLGICAKAYINGNREGAIHLYNKNTFPLGYIGKVHFIWVPNCISKLWLFVHPSQVKQVESVLTNFLSDNTKSDDYETVSKKRRLTNNFSENIKIKTLWGIFNRFRLTGPNSQAILSRSLKSIDNIDKIKTNYWVSCLINKNHELHLKEKHDYWQNISSGSSASMLPPSIIMGLIVRDPRLSRPSYRTKAQQKYEQVNVQSLINISSFASSSPLWDTNIHDTIKNKRMSNSQFIDHVTKTQLVPGEVNENDPALQSVPVVLIQRPGSQNSTFKKIGYGSGWDIIVPSGYGLPFWQTFIMFGARSGGLRESESLAFEMGDNYLSPDSDAGQEEEKRVEITLRERYFKLPPSKRINYVKLGINSPFLCPWKILLKDWSNTPIDNFFVLRDKKILNVLQDSVTRKKDISNIDKASSSLVTVYLKLVNKGNLKKHALICLPQPGDIDTIETLFEPHHEDLNEKIRKQNKIQHLKGLKRIKKERRRLKKTATIDTHVLPKHQVSEPSEYVKGMRELWLPSNIQTVRYSSSREVLGYILNGGFSFSEAKNCGIGYIAYNALSTLLKTGQNQVLIRNTSSRKYRLANIQISVVL